MSFLLIIDDDTEFCEVLADCLRIEGFDVSILHDGKEGLAHVLAGFGKYDLILLDLGLPGMNGFQVLRGIRSRLAIPILMMTGSHDEMQRITGLEMGTDDYLTKPFNPRELMARVRAILRRTGDRHAGRTGVPRLGKIVVGDIEMDIGSRDVRRSGERLDLTSVEFSFLEMLLKSAGHVVTRQQMAESILGRHLTAYDRSVDVHLSSLRKKLGHKVCGIERIKTIRGVGYVYAIPSQPVQDTRAC